MEENVYVINEINKGSTMAMDAIRCILSSCSDNKLKKELEKEFDGYKLISNKANKLFSNYSNLNIKENTIISKIIILATTKIKIHKNEDKTKIAEHIIKGTNMGIINIRKLLNSKNVDENVKKLLDEFINMQEKYLESLKMFL